MANESEEEAIALKAAGAEPLPEGRTGLRINGWEIESRNKPILNSLRYEQWEQKLKTTHLPEMVFGDSDLVLLHNSSGIKIHFNTFDALTGWKQEALPPVEVPAAAQWKFRRCSVIRITLTILESGLAFLAVKPFQQVILDYDYTFTTPYRGSETMEMTSKLKAENITEGSCSLQWEDCMEKIDVVALASKEPILFYDEVVLYEDELSDNGVSLLTVKVRVMPSCWFLLLRFWLRVDGVLMRLRDTRVHCAFEKDENPVVLRDSCWREATFQSLAAKGLPSDSAAYSDPNLISKRLPVVMHKTQKLKILR
ncbi:hypothetical protein GIB67_023539 [Kingdonia uniflora]|uniref:TIP41-like protein n=1 Tax=Kingdonia uniflora TaxID=39325 RepID=A0A7J7PAP0_9MAGN|nr:hypothetical protein GIB67_023539 [Kingdonia uniflora]